MKAVLIALGSNLGERDFNLAVALKKIDGQLARVEQTSDFYQTVPIGGPPQGDFLNGAAILKTSLSPTKLLGGLLKIEEEMGRKRLEKWGPREIDLDIILYEQDIIEQENLKIPHPLAHQRSFVLEPAAQIAPRWYHPVQKQTLMVLYQKLISSQEMVL